MSIIKARRVAINAKAEIRDMNTVPALWYAAPQIPNNTATPASPAAIGCKMSEPVKPWITEEFSLVLLNPRRDGGK